MTEMFQQIIEIKSLYNAWRKVRANKGSAGIDRVSCFGFEENLDANLAELSRNLRTLTYQPLPAKFVKIAKANGKTRELGILTIRDRVAQRAVLDVIEPIFEAEMQDCSYAFRPNRSIEMAVQRLIVHKANDNQWTVESDIRNYFAEIDIRILMDDLSEKIKDDKVLHLIELWLEAGTLNESDAETEKNWWQTTQENLNDVQDLIGETMKDSIDEFIASKLGLSSYENEYMQMNPEVQDLFDIPDENDFSAKIRTDMDEARSGTNRKVIKRILESGLLFALSNRKYLSKFVGVKAFGIGGALVAGTLLAPKAYELANNYFYARRGVLQGSPISPLLANIYLNKFDKELTAKGYKLIRYCDDFVISCKSQNEADDALKMANGILRNRKLSLHPDKTRIIRPNEEFEFLGFQFAENGIVKPPSKITTKLAEQIRLASEKVSKAASRATDFKKVQKLNTWECLLKIINQKK